MAVPSRGRPQNIARLHEAMEATCRGDTALLVGLDAGDPTGPDYPHGPAYEWRGDLHFAVAWLNALTVPRATGDRAYPQYRFIGALGDDNLPRTEGWDVAVMEALGKTPFAFGNERYPGRPPGTSCCHIFCRSSVVKTLGYIGVPSLRHMYVDNAWAEWGRAAGITYLDDVVIEHVHYTTGRAEFDETYARSAPLMAADEVAWREYRESPDGLAADIAKLAGLA